jgi:hypothetical protein
MSFNAKGAMDRFHPLAVTYEDVSGWWVCDGHANTEHSLAVPCIEEPCEDRDEAVALCAILNEDHESSVNG